MQQPTVDTERHNGWATIAEVSEVLAVKSDTIKHAVQKAYALQQNWVKREPYPAPGCPLRWLIDTNHVIYQYHEKRWRKLAKKTNVKQPSKMPASVQGEEVNQRKSQPGPIPDVQQQAFNIVEAWPELCHWLAKRGLVVFVNVISADQSWAWSWGSNAGSGYSSATAAITAALQHQLVVPPSQDMPSDSTPVSAEPELPLWNSLFRWKW